MTLIFAWSAPSACVQQLQLEFRVNNSTFCCAERSVISNLQLCIYAIAPVGALPCSSDTQCNTAQHVNCVLADCSLISSLIVLFSLIYHHDDASYWTHEIKSNLLINWDFLPFLWSRSKAQVLSLQLWNFLQAMSDGHIWNIWSELEENCSFLAECCFQALLLVDSNSRIWFPSMIYFRSSNLEHYCKRHAVRLYRPHVSWEALTRGNKPLKGLSTSISATDCPRHQALCKYC